jgi:hypothetical protein
LIRSKQWQDTYGNRHFLKLAKQAFKRQIIETSFIQCWTIWEHLFTILNKSWLSEDKNNSLSSIEKISYILIKYDMKEIVSKKDKEKIKALAEIRNKLVHNGRLPKRESVYSDSELFIRLTEFIIAKILGLSPSNLFNTVEKLDDFLK